jgi:hypothetical protein
VRNIAAIAWEACTPQWLAVRTAVRPAATLALSLALCAAGAHAARAQTPAPMMTPLPAASPSPLPTTPPVPENPLVTARVRQAFTAWQHGRIDRKEYSPAAGGTYIDAYVAVVSPDLTAIGPLQSVQYRTTSLLLGDLVYRYDISGSTGAVSVLYALDARGRTDGIVFTPLIFRMSAP